MINYKYLFLLIIGSIWMWFFFGYLFHDLTILIRACIVIYILLYIDEGVRRKMKLEKLKKDNKYIQASITSPNIILFGHKVRIRWIYHIFATTLFLGVIFFEYDLSWHDQRFQIAALLLIGLTLLIEVISYLLEKVYWSKKQKKLD